MKEDLISIIVPVYNSEITLLRCVDSILAQTYRNFELLLINDGSKDRSGEICNEYARKDSRVRVFHKDNGGVSSARNVVLSTARGRWVSFIDSDDWIDVEYIEIMYRQAVDRGCSLVTCDFVEIKRGGETRICNSFDWTGNDTVDTNVLNRKELLERVISRSYGVVWNLLINKELIERYSLSFDTQLQYGEDNLFLCKLHLYAEKHFHVRNILYYYDRTNEGSLMNHKTIDYHLDNVSVSLHYLSLFSGVNINTHLIYLRLINSCYELIIAPCYYYKIQEALSLLPSKYLLKCPDVTLKRRFVLWLILNGYTSLISSLIVRSPHYFKHRC